LDFMVKNRVYVMLILLTLFSGQAIAAESRQSLAERRQATLSDARAGKFDTALPALQALTKEAPNDVGIQADYIVALTWAKKNQEALDFAKSMNLQTTPTYGVSALARAARDVRDFPQALSLYDQLIKREPNNLDPLIGKVLTQADAKQFVEAENTLIVLRQQHPNNPEVYRALSYLGLESKQPILVVDANMRLLELNNQDLDAARTLIPAAREAGATSQARSLAEQYPQVVDKNEIDKIHNDRAAQHIAWSHYNPTIPAERFADTDQALARLDAACQCDWNGLDLSLDKNKNLVFDRMVALHDRYRMQEVIEHYQQLVNAKVDPPAYVLNAAADAYLYKRMPEEALKIYDATILKAPDHLVEVKMGKFYALIELERFDEATALIDSTSQDLAAYRNRPNNPVVRTDEFKLEADSKAYYARVYGDDFATAEQRFLALNNIGPMNNEVRVALADIWRFRGWPERSEKLAYEITNDYPEHVAPKVILANTHMDLRDWRLAESEIKPLVSDFPENLSVQELDRRWLLHNKRQLTIGGFRSKSSGSAFGSRTHGLNAALYSSPINYNFRAFALAEYQHATYPEGNGNAVFPGIGLEYTNRDWRLTGAVSKSNISENGVTAAFTADYRLNDYWSFSSLLDINSSQMPLRGLRVGISGDLFNASGTYRWSDLTSASMGVGYMHMDDGNNRNMINATFDRRLLTRPHYKLTAHLRADASRNTEQNVPYFNPQRDLEVGAILDNEWMLWRRYERSFSHRLQVGAGDYWQKDFGSDLTWIASYEQQIRLDDRFELDYGVTRNRHSYDGVKELATQYFVRLNLLF
jgi:biofilm PGA synthesis protein PgaA